MQSDSTPHAWLKFLNPQTLRNNLIRASLHLAAFEMVENSVISGLRGAYCYELDESNQLRDSADYKTNVLSRDKSRFAASLNWLVENGVIDKSDELLAQRLREHRNLIGHQLPAILASPGYEIDPTMLDSLYQLVAKIDRHWIREFEMPSNSDFDQIDPYSVPDSEITSGNMLFLALMRDIGIGEIGDDVYRTVVDNLKNAGMIQADNDPMHLSRGESRV